MYKLLITLLLTALLAGCASSARYTEAALSWESAPTHQLIATLGNPTFFYPAEDRGDILFWHFKKVPSITSYVRNATQKLLNKDECTNPKMAFSEKTLCRPSSDFTLREKPAMPANDTLLAESDAYDCQIVATLSESGETVSKIDVLAEGNCDMLQLDQYTQLSRL